MKTARLISLPASDRIDATGGDCSSPQIGDIVVLDQGFTFPDGRPGGMVYCVDSEGRLKWNADLYDSEIELIE
jgi:hypothetical protein